MTMQPKDYEIHIHGKFCKTPHPDRKICLEISDTLSSEMALIMLHDTLNDLVKDHISAGFNSDNFGDAFETFHLGPHNGEPLKSVNTKLTGSFYGEKDWAGVVYIDPTLDMEETFVILYEILCCLRNNIATKMSREEMEEFAERHKIYNLGMTANEEPFKTR